MKTLGKVLLIALISILILGFSWGITVGLIKLITICFSLTFSIRVATDIWLGIFLFNLLFYKGRGSDK